MLTLTQDPASHVTEKAETGRNKCILLSVKLQGFLHLTCHIFWLHPTVKGKMSLLPMSGWHGFHWSLGFYPVLLPQGCFYYFRSLSHVLWDSPFLIFPICAFADAVFIFLCSQCTANSPELYRYRLHFLPILLKPGSALFYFDSCVDKFYPSLWLLSDCVTTFYTMAQVSFWNASTLGSVTQPLCSFPYVSGVIPFLLLLVPYC